MDRFSSYPLSEKRLRNRYEKCGLLPDDVFTLKQYLNAFSNLYGVLSNKEAYTVLLKLEKSRFDEAAFCAFLRIARQDPSTEFSIYRADEILREADRTDAAYLIVHPFLIHFRYYKYELVRELLCNRKTLPFYIPKAEEILYYQRLHFFDNESGKMLSDLIEGQKSNGLRFDTESGAYRPFTDAFGRQTAGRSLKDIRLSVRDEDGTLCYSDASRIYQNFLFRMIGLEFAYGAANAIRRSEAELRQNYGVSLDISDYEKFVMMLKRHHDESRLWRYCGNRLKDLKTVSEGDRGSEE